MPLYKNYILIARKNFSDDADIERSSYISSGFKGAKEAGEASLLAGTGALGYELWREYNGSKPTKIGIAKIGDDILDDSKAELIRKMNHPDDFVDFYRKIEGRLGSSIGSNDFAKILTNLGENTEKQGQQLANMFKHILNQNDADDISHVREIFKGLLQAGKEDVAKSFYVNVSADLSRTEGSVLNQEVLDNLVQRAKTNSADADFVKELYKNCNPQAQAKLEMSFRKYDFAEELWHDLTKLSAEIDEAQKDLDELKVQKKAAEDELKQVQQKLDNNNKSGIKDKALKNLKEDVTRQEQKIAGLNQRIEKSEKQLAELKNVEKDFRRAQEIASRERHLTQQVTYWAKGKAKKVWDPDKHQSLVLRKSLNSFKKHKGKIALAGAAAGIAAGVGHHIYKSFTTTIKGNIDRILETDSHNHFGYKVTGKIKDYLTTKMSLPTVVQYYKQFLKDWYRKGDTYTDFIVSDVKVGSPELRYVAMVCTTNEKSARKNPSARLKLYFETKAKLSVRNKEDGEKGKKQDIDTFSYDVVELRYETSAPATILFMDNVIDKNIPWSFAKKNDLTEANKPGTFCDYVKPIFNWDIQEDDYAKNDLPSKVYPYTAYYKEDVEKIPSPLRKFGFKNNDDKRLNATPFGDEE